MSAPVTAEELAAAERCAVSLTSIAPYHTKSAAFGGAAFEFHARAQTTVERAAEMLPRLARDLTAAQASIRGLIEALNEAQTDRDALTTKIETMLRDEEDARALRIAEHAAREDVAGKLEALRAAVRAHHEAITAAHQMPGFARPTPAETAERLWTAAKA